MDFVAWLEKRCSGGQSQNSPPLGRRFSPAAGTAQTTLQRQTMQKSHSRGLRPGWGKGETGRFGKCLHFPRTPPAGPGAGRGAGPQQHRVVCAPSAGPAAPPHPGRGQTLPRVPAAPPWQTGTQSAPRQFRPAGMNIPSADPAGLLLERPVRQPKVGEDGSRGDALPASAASRHSRKKKDRLSHFPKSTLQWTHTETSPPKTAKHPPGKREAEQQTCKVAPCLTAISPPNWGISLKAVRGGQAEAPTTFSDVLLFLGEEVCEESHFCS